MSEPTHTIYIHPGENRCRVYAMPYPMRPGQSPRDLAWEYQRQWSEIAMLNHKLDLVYIDKDYAHLRGDIEGQMGGTFFQVNLEESRAAAKAEAARLAASAGDAAAPAPAPRP